MEDHPERAVSITDVEEVLSDVDRDERYDSHRDTYLVLGRTKAGRWLIVVWVDPARTVSNPCEASQQYRT
jgi:uncharacterized protein YpmB